MKINLHNIFAGNLNEGIRKYSKNLTHEAVIKSAFLAIHEAPKMEYADSGLGTNADRFLIIFEGGIIFES